MLVSDPELPTFRFSGVGIIVRQIVPAFVTCISALIRIPMNLNERRRMRPTMRPPGHPLPHGDLRPWWVGECGEPDLAAPVRLPQVHSPSTRQPGGSPRRNLVGTLSGCAPGWRVVALGKVEGMPPAHPTELQQFWWLAIPEACLSVRAHR